MTLSPPSRAFTDYAVTLPNGKGLWIRALARDEDGPIRELHAALSPRSRYLRFFAPVPVLPDSVIAVLLGNGDGRSLALVAESSGTGEIVGLATLAPVDDRTAEVALVVRDDWQRQRVGTSLAHALAAAAERSGFERFVAHVLWENGPVRALLKRMTVVLSARSVGGACELLFVRTRSHSDSAGRRSGAHRISGGHSGRPTHPTE